MSSQAINMAQIGADVNPLSSNFLSKYRHSNLTQTVPHVKQHKCILIKQHHGFTYAGKHAHTRMHAHRLTHTQFYVTW